MNAKEMLRTYRREPKPTPTIHVLSAKEVRSLSRFQRLFLLLQCGCEKCSADEMLEEVAEKRRKMREEAADEDVD